MIIVTDAHIGKNTDDQAAFFRMLESFERTGHDVVFLGDIFELWIAMPRYEEDIHARFRAWCRSQKTIRTIGFLEGNHEFYLEEKKPATFTWCSKIAWQPANTGVLFVHGDQINPKDKMYLIFRQLTKNKFAKFILHTLPFGPLLIGSIQLELNRKNSKDRRYIPKGKIEKFAESRFAEGVDTIFVGHFHREYRYRNADSKELWVLPDWFSTQKITVYQEHPKQITTIPWQELPAVGRL
jgi:UDP-2,3-diacylglucosamine hydrolase